MTNKEETHRQINIQGTRESDKQTDCKTYKAN